MAIDFWAIGPTAAAHHLRLCGFTSGEAERLVALKARYERHEVDELTEEARHALFVGWLVEHGYFTDWPDESPPHGRAR